MRYAVAGLLTFAFALTAPDKGSAQQHRGDGSGPAVQGSTVSPQVANTRRFVVPFFRSDVTAGFRSASVVTVVNNAANSCEVRVDFFRGTILSAPVCSITGIVDGGFSLDFCSRAVPASVTGCNFTCAPALTSDEGKVLVFTADTNPCKRVRIDPRVYYLSGTTSDAGVVAVSNTQVVN